MGKIEPVANSGLMFNTVKSTTNNTKLIFNQPPVIKWNDEPEYPTLDELSRISKVKKDFITNFPIEFYHI